MDPQIIQIAYMLFLFLTIITGALTMLFVFEKHRIEEEKERKKLL